MQPEIPPQPSPESASAGAGATFVERLEELLVAARSHFADLVKLRESLACNVCGNEIESPICKDCFAKSAKGASAPEWVSVEKENPRLSGYYTVILDKQGELFVVNISYDTLVKQWEISLPCRVTHWLHVELPPLPTKPKERDQEEEADNTKLIQDNELEKRIDELGWRIEELERSEEVKRK